MTYYIMAIQSTDMTLCSLYSIFDYFTASIFHVKHFLKGKYHIPLLSDNSFLYERKIITLQNLDNKTVVFAFFYMANGRKVLIGWLVGWFLTKQDYFPLCSCVVRTRNQQLYLYTLNSQSGDVLSVVLFTVGGTAKKIPCVHYRLDVYAYEVSVRVKCGIKI